MKILPASLQNRRRALVVLASTALGASCSVDRETQITVALQSEAQVPSELKTFRVRVTNMRRNEVRWDNEYFPQDGTYFPTTLAIVPADEDSLGSPLKIEIEGRGANDDLILSRTAVASYIEGRNILLSMPLRMACFQFRDCGPGLTCRGGQCAPAEVGPDELVDFEERYVSRQAQSCFDEEKCLRASSLVTVADDCTFPIPGEAVNVAIRWAAAPTRLLALESDDKQEGWTRLAAGRGLLSQGVCDSHFQRKGPDGKPLVSDWAKQVYVTEGCPAKTALTPYCFSSATQHAGVGAISPEP